MTDHTHLPGEVRLLVPAGNPWPVREEGLDVRLGEMGRVGRLGLHAWGDQRMSSFAYSRDWLMNKRFFPLSPELHKTPSRQWRKAPAGGGRNVFAALADTVPSGFASLVVKRARERGLLDGFRTAAEASESLDALCAVPDITRQGALRLHPTGEPTVDFAGQRCLLPCRADLDGMGVAIAAFERGAEDLRQLQLLLLCATGLGGSRPKCTWVRDDGQLAVASFPSVLDPYPVNPTSELLSRFAKAVGINVVDLAPLHPNRSLVRLALRFDRARDGSRKHFMSARSMVLAEEGDEIDPLELLQAMRGYCKDFAQDALELWRRLVFGALTDDAGNVLRKTDFLYVADGLWRLAPAHGLKPRYRQDAQAISRARVLNLDWVIENSKAFGVSRSQARYAVQSQRDVVDDWKRVV